MNIKKLKKRMEQKARLNSVQINFLKEYDYAN